MAVGEQRDVATGLQRPLDDPLDALTDFFDGLAAGHPIPPQEPARPLLLDVDGAATLIGAVVPFHEVVGEHSTVFVAGEPAGLDSADQRAREHHGKRPSLEAPSYRPRPSFPGFVEGDVRAAGVAVSLAPLRLAVAEKPDLLVIAHRLASRRLREPDRSSRGAARVASVHPPVPMCPARRGGQGPCCRGSDRRSAKRSRWRPDG